MLGPTGKSATFRAQTCIEPDRIALLARDVSQLVRGSLRGGVIRFDGATPGCLAFSVRSRMARSELLSFRVDIARRDDGLTNVDVHIRDHRVASRQPAGLPDPAEPRQGYDVYKRYARELATALARFDPQSTAILVETSEA
jgi:hypothetical protein